MADEPNEWPKEKTACQEATETEPNPRMMQSIEEHEEIPKGEATGVPVGRPRKRVGSRIWPRSAARSGRKGLRDIVDSGESWLPPAKGCPAVQNWHGEKGTSSGIFGLKEIVDRRRNYPPAGI
jgi:hypothetical protein